MLAPLARTKGTFGIIYDRPKIERRLIDCIWLGVRGRTEESIIGTPQGVVNAFTVKRRPV